MSVTIRPFTDDDYGALAELASICWGEVYSEDGIRFDDGRRQPHIRFGRFVAEADGKLIGAGDYDQHAGAYHPRRFDLGVSVHPDYRRQGVGSAIWDHLMTALQPFDPIAVTAGTREDWPEGIRFLEKRGFVEQQRQWESKLELNTFDPAAFGDALEGAEAQGYTIRSLQELAGLPDRDRQIYDLALVARRDIPSAVPLTDVPFEVWAKNFENPKLLPDLYLIAIKDGQMIGMSNIWESDEKEVLHTGFTGILREHRGTGIARALKVAALSRAKALGHREVRTWNASTNAKMLAINFALGFVRNPGWILSIAELKAEA